MLSIMVSLVSYAIGFGAAYFLMISFYVQVAPVSDWQQDPPVVTPKQRQLMRFSSVLLAACSVSLLFYSATLKRSANAERDLIRQTMQRKARNYADSTGLEWRLLGKNVTLAESRKILRDLQNRQLLSLTANPAQLEQMAINLNACISNKAVQGEKSKQIISPVVTGCLTELGYVKPAR